MPSLFQSAAMQHRRNSCSRISRHNHGERDSDLTFELLLVEVLHDRLHALLGLLPRLLLNHLLLHLLYNVAKSIRPHLPLPSPLLTQPTFLSIQNLPSGAPPLPASVPLPSKESYRLIDLKGSCLGSRYGNLVSLPTHSCAQVAKPYGGIVISKQQGVGAP